jgi:hypothetical protein
MGIFGAIWGIVGLSWLFSSAMVRLYPYVAELYDQTFAWYHWLGLAVSLLFMGYAEGYKGFQLRFAPRAAARALYLKRNPTILRVLLAPLFCMGYFHATRKRKIVSFSLTLMIILLIISVHKLKQPVHGIVDVGVLFGIGWGTVSVWIFSVKAFFGKAEYMISPETPDV